jgi:hypothetical protein
MLIRGPLKIGIVDTDNNQRELHLDFTQEFKSLNLSERCDSFKDFINTLKTEIDTLDENAPDKQGMLTIFQISEQLRPHIESDEIPLEDTIIISINADNPFGNIQTIVEQ